MDDITDLLALTYYGKLRINPYRNVLWKYNTYVRLDRSIENLLEALDKKVGLQNGAYFRHFHRIYGQRIALIRDYTKVPGGEFYSTVVPPF